MSGSDGDHQQETTKKVRGVRIKGGRIIRVLKCLLSHSSLPLGSSQECARSGLWSLAKCCKTRFGVEEAVGAFGDTLLDLSLYRPVPGLTEEAFAKCKALLCKVAATKEAFWTTIREMRI